MPRWFVMLAAAGILVRAGILVQYVGSPFSEGLILDAELYWDWAGRIARGGWLPHRVFHQGPLYPYLLGAFRALLPSASPVAVAAAQLALNWITCLLFLPLLTRMGRRDLGLGSASLALFFGPAAFMSLKVLSVTAGLFLLQAGLLALMPPGAPTRRRLAAGGCLWGLACLAFPMMALAIPLLLLWLAVPGGTVRASGTSIVPVLAGVLVVIAPVTIQNYLQDGSFVLISSNYGLTFAHGNNALAVGDYAPLPGISADVHHQERDSTARAEREEGRELNSGQVARHYVGKGITFMLENPARSAGLWARKLALVLGGRDVPLEYSLSRERRDLLPLLWCFPTGGTLVLALAAVGLAGGRGSLRALVPFLAVAVSLGVACVVFFVANRYVFPVSFFLMPAAAAALTQPPHGRRLILAGAPALALVLVPALLTARIIPDRVPEATYLANLAMAYGRTGKREQAAAAFARALALDPDNPAARAGLGLLHLERGDPASAVDAFRHAVLLDPLNVQTRIGLARSLRAMGNLAEAARALETARAIDPGNAGTGLLIAQVLIDRGDWTGARREVEQVLRIDPRSADAHYLMSTIIREAGDRAGAMAELRRAIEQDQGFAEAYGDLAVDEYFSGNPERALELAKTAAKLGGVVPPGFMEAVQKALKDPQRRRGGGPS